MRRRNVIILVFALPLLACIVLLGALAYDEYDRYRIACDLAERVGVPPPKSLLDAHEELGDAVRRKLSGMTRSDIISAYADAPHFQQGGSSLRFGYPHPRTGAEGIYCLVRFKGESVDSIQFDNSP